jgi:hypothetical protein
LLHRRSQTANGVITGLKGFLVNEKKLRKKSVFAPSSNINGDFIPSF